MIGNLILVGPALGSRIQGIILETFDNVSNSRHSDQSFLPSFPV